MTWKELSAGDIERADDKTLRGIANLLLDEFFPVLRKTAPLTERLRKHQIGTFSFADWIKEESDGSGDSGFSYPNMGRQIEKLKVIALSPKKRTTEEEAVFQKLERKRELKLTVYKCWQILSWADRYLSIPSEPEILDLSGTKWYAYFLYYEDYNKEQPTLGKANVEFINNNVTFHFPPLSGRLELTGYFHSNEEKVFNTLSISLKYGRPTKARLDIALRLFYSGQRAAVGKYLLHLDSRIRTGNIVFLNANNYTDDTPPGVYSPWRNGNEYMKMDETIINYLSNSHYRYSELKGGVLKREDLVPSYNWYGNLPSRKGKFLDQHAPVALLMLPEKWADDWLQYSTVPEMIPLISELEPTLKGMRNLIKTINAQVPKITSMAFFSGRYIPLLSKDFDQIIRNRGLEPDPISPAQVYKEKHFTIYFLNDYENIYFDYLNIDLAISGSKTVIVIGTKSQYDRIHSTITNSLIDPKFKLIEFIEAHDTEKVDDYVNSIINKLVSTIQKHLPK